MTLSEHFISFFNQYNGKPVEKEDPSNLDQCFDLAFAWADELTIPRDSIRHFRAFQIFTNPNPDTSQFFTIIVNTPTGVPQQGDLVIFSTVVGVSGHVCIATGTGNTAYFESFDQNWAGKLYATTVKHSYNGVLGWLRPINHQVPEPSQGGGVNMAPTVLNSDVIKAIYRKMIGREIPDSDLTLEESKIPFSVEDTIGRFMSPDFLKLYDLHTSAELLKNGKANYDQGFSDGKSDGKTVPVPVPTLPVPDLPSVPTGVDHRSLWERIVDFFNKPV